MTTEAKVTNRMTDSDAAKSTASDEPWTVARLLDWTTGFFKSRGSESPRLDAEVLLAHALETERILMYTRFAEEPTEEQKTAFREMVRRRGGGAPVAQLVGHKEFYSMKFRVDESTLIPRPETEELVIAVLDHLKTNAPSDRPPRVADIGTGSGCIALSIAKHSADAEVVATDLSPAALKIAAYNADSHGLNDRVTFVESDLLAALNDPESFDVIVSNPPYVSEGEYAALDPSVRDHEPESALVAGPDGTDVIRRIIDECVPRLSDGGLLVIEHSPMNSEAVRRIATDAGTLLDVQTHKDGSRQERYLTARKA